MAGLDPAIHLLRELLFEKRWMPGSSPGMTSRLAMQLRDLAGTCASLAINIPISEIQKLWERCW
jgi:hypothetical protein